MSTFCKGVKTKIVLITWLIQNYICGTPFVWFSAIEKFCVYRVVCSCPIRSKLIKIVITIEGAKLK